MESVAKEVVATLLRSRSSLYRKYGERGRKKCHEDTVYHLHYLSEAIAAGSEHLFVDYVGWAKVMLASRKIHPKDLILNLKGIVAVIRRRAQVTVSGVVTKYVQSALLRFENLPETLPSYLASSNSLAKVANEYLKALLLLNRKDAEAVVQRELQAGLRVRDLINEVVFPVQQEVGRLWQENRITVLQEHYCTAATEMLLTQLRQDFKGTLRNVRALALCPEGEQHCLGIKLFAELLESNGWHVAYIGPNCPSADVLKHLSSTKTDLVAISVTTPLSMPNARQLVAKIRELKLKIDPWILVGGRALGSDPQLSRGLQADGWATNIFDGLTVANRLAAMPKRSSA